MLTKNIDCSAFLELFYSHVVLIYFNEYVDLPALASIHPVTQLCTTLAEAAIDADHFFPRDISPAASCDC